MMLNNNIVRTSKLFEFQNPESIKRVDCGIRLFMKESSTPIRLGLMFYLSVGTLLNFILGSPMSSLLLSKIPIMKSLDDLFVNLILIYLYDD